MDRSFHSSGLHYSARLEKFHEQDICTEPGFASQLSVTLLFELIELCISVENRVLFGSALANRVDRRNLTDNDSHRESCDALGSGLCARTRVQQFSD